VTSRLPGWRGFYFITDSTLTKNGVMEDVRKALSAGVVFVQYREKLKSFEEREAEARRILDLCREARVPLLINDDVELCRRIGADGVHLGQEDTPAKDARSVLGPHAVVGVSVLTDEEAREAEAAGADYMAASSVFPTKTKPDASPPVGIEGIKRIRSVTGLPLAAIGGISLDNVAAVVEAGADMVCAISASLKDGKVEENIQRIKETAGLD